MAARSPRFGLLAAPVLLAASQAQTPRLPYDPAVYLAGTCLSPALNGCNAAARGTASASQAVLGLDLKPRLSFELGGLLDLGPQIAGGRGPDEVTLR